MQPMSDTTRRLGAVLRQHLPPAASLPPELKALLLRLALAEAERRHYGGSTNPAASFPQVAAGRP
jgi:hypothetical protein